MDKKLLMDLFHIPSMSGQEVKVQSFIMDKLDNMGIEYDIDKKGNIYNISHDNKPMLSAHMDTVQDYNDVLFAKFIEIKDDIINGYGVIGGDDKCGIYIILELLKEGHHDVNFCFTVEEEVGGIGSSYFDDNNDLTNMLYCLVLDRKGNDDILCASYHDYGTPEFEDVLLEMGAEYGYNVGSGTFCDADYFSNQLSCANISVGYYNAHTKQEFVNLRDLQNAVDFVHSVITHIDIKFEAPIPFTYTNSVKPNSTQELTKLEEDFGWMDEYGWIDEYDDDLYPPPSRTKSIGKKTTNEHAYCDLCGKWSTSRFIKSLGMNACSSCVDDLLWELTEDIVSEDIEVM